MINVLDHEEVIEGCSYANRKGRTQRKFISDDPKSFIEIQSPLFDVYLLILVPIPLDYHREPSGCVSISEPLFY